MRKDRKLCQVRKADVTLPLESSREERQPSKPRKNKTRYTYRERSQLQTSTYWAVSRLSRLLEKGPLELVTE